MSTRTPAETWIPPERRIYCNRNLRLSRLGAIGFDLDHTLAHYRGPEVERVTYELVRERLVERLGYPEILLRLPYEREFVIRGLVVDKRRGLVLKMDYHNYVARAYRGRRLLDTAQRRAAYQKGRIRMGSPSYISVDTLFHLPEVFLFAVLVDMLDRGLLPRGITTRKIADDVRATIDSVHGDGTLKERILGRISRFIRRDERLRLALEEFRESGKKLFLLTNSELYYSEALLGYLLAPRGGRRRKEAWLDLFDLVVVDAGKPRFFTDLDRKPTGRDSIADTPVMHGGNARLLEKAIGFRGDEILYFGDHTYGDILRSKKTLGWRTAMVVEELEDELAATRQVEGYLGELAHWAHHRDGLDAEITALRRGRRDLERRLAAERKKIVREDLETQIRENDAQLAELEEELEGVRQLAHELGDTVTRAYNPYWGPLFREGREMSRFGHQVKDFACIYTTRVSNFTSYDSGHYFRSPQDRMPHELD